MAGIIIVKPTRPTLPPNPDQQQQTDYNTALAAYMTNLVKYKSYLEEIRFNTWDSLTELDLPDNRIDTLSRLQEAEDEILRRYGNTSLSESDFNNLDEEVQNRLIRGIIIQTALLILPTIPQIKRAEFSNFEGEFFQLTNREKLLEDRLNKLFPDTPEIGNMVTTGGANVNRFVAF